MRHDVDQAHCRACGWSGDWHEAEYGCPVCGADTIDPVADTDD